MFYKVILMDKKDKYSEDRYIIVDEDNNILDDAQGYGYRSKHSAHRAYAYKNNKELQQKHNEINEWKRKNHYLFDELNDSIAEIYFYEFKAGNEKYRIDFDTFKEICDTIGIKEESFNNKFTLNDLFKRFR